MHYSKAIIAICLILITTVFFGCGNKEASGDTDEGTGETTGLTAPPEGFEMIAGDQFDLTQYKGKVVVVDIWATWCPPCKKEIPELIEINNEYKDKGVVMIGISVDDNAKEVVPEFAKKVGMNYPNYDGMSPNLQELYKTPGYPTKIFYDKEGNEAKRQVGIMTKNEIIAEIDKLL